MPMSNTAADYLRNSAIPQVEHLAAHLADGFDSITDHCDRELVAESSRGLAGQVRHAFHSVLSDVERSHVNAALPSSATEYEDEDDWMHAIADAIEQIDPAEADGYTYRWEDGELYRYAACEDFGNPEEDLWVDEAFLEVIALRNGDGDVEHVRAILTVGGPNVALMRDWAGDQLAVGWGGEVVRHSSDEVTAVLDAIAEFYEEMGVR